MDTSSEENAGRYDTVLVSDDGLLTYKPNCASWQTPFVDKTFKTLNMAILFYQTYGRAGGFSTRRYTEKLGKGKHVLMKYMVCSKQGEFRERSESPESPVTKKRKRILTRTNCDAMIRFTYVNSEVGYKVSKFVECHNHPLVGKSHSHQLRGNRHVSERHIEWLDHCHKSGIGPTEAHRLMSIQCGGPEHVGATRRDFINYQRDLKAFIGNSDVQIIIENFRTRKEANNSFFYDYDEDTSGRLTKLFWCDEISVKNYELYGDSVTFDSTYRTNMYSMPICPFTGVDNYKKSITFGIGLVTHEDTESFTWMFRTFLRAMKNKQPRYIITDQDPAMKIALPRVMPESKHKFCMWHIMDKLSAKVPNSLLRDTDFEDRFYDVVYNNDINPIQFEARWGKLLAEHNLEDHVWLKSMYDIRHQWIPAYYRDLPMGQFMRTTSRSESTNSAFQKFTDRYWGLVQLVWGCSTVVDNQRQEHYRLMMQSYASNPHYHSTSVLEIDAWNLYTRPIFEDVQNDIKDIMDFCSLKEMGDEDGCLEFTVVDTKYINPGKEFHVKRTIGSEEFECGCNKLMSSGMICSHIFFVLHTTGFKQIPRALVYNRWCREKDMDNIMCDNSLKNGELEMEDIDVVTALKTRFQEILEMHNPDMASMRGLLNMVNAYNVKTIDDVVEETQMTRAKQIASVTGIVLPEIINIQPPAITNTKGSRLGADQRMVRDREKAIEESKKPKRMCKTCMKVDNHDSRNCPLKTKA